MPVPQTFGRRTLVAATAALPGLAVRPHLGTQAPIGRPAGTPAGTLIAGSEGIDPVNLVATLIDPDSINDSGPRYGVYGADLGHTFQHKDAMYMVFGDTFGMGKSDWRSNVAAVITDSTPHDGLLFDRMIEDTPGHAKVLISQNMVEGAEVTVIPTYGVSLGGRMVLHYMAVSFWGEPGHWDLSHSGLAHSDDDGETWTVDNDATWPSDSNFGQVAIVESDDPDTLFVFGIPGGRYGGAALAQVPRAQMLDLSAWRYWDGSDWVPDHTAATIIIPAPVGELSVRWNSHYGKWLMMYLIDNAGQIVLRTADELTGPWSGARIVTTAADYPALYAPFILSRFNDGPEIWFTMSMFGPYSVSLMQTILTR